MPKGPRRIAPGPMHGPVYDPGPPGTPQGPSKGPSDRTKAAWRAMGIDANDPVKAAEQGAAMRAAMRGGNAGPGMYSGE